MALLLALVSGTLLTIGDLIILKWVKTNNPWSFTQGLTIYTVALAFMIMACKYKHIAIVSVTMVVLNVVCLLIVSRILYGDRFNAAQIGGICLGLLAIIVLEFSK
jgi:multidrug transporter EmrE-like cation transporter